MNVTLIAERYAKALFELALERNVLEEVNKDVLHLAGLIRESRPLKLFLKAPIINPGKKKTIMNEVLRGANPLTASFVDLLVAKRREKTIPDIALQFILQYNRYKNIVIVNVKSAIPLNDALRARLNSIMASYTGAHIQTVEVVDESVIGGFVLSWDDKQYDASILTQLEKMKKGVARFNLYVKKLEHGRN